MLTFVLKIWKDTRKAVDRKAMSCNQLPQTVLFISFPLEAGLWNRENIRLNYVIKKTPNLTDDFD